MHIAQHIHMKGIIVSLFISLFFLVSQLYADIIVTDKERFSGKITSFNKGSVTMRTDEAREIAISSKRILQIYDAKGVLVWQKGEQDKESKKAEDLTPLDEKLPAYANNAIIFDFYVGATSGGFYTEEDSAIDSLGIYGKYSDGSTQAAKTGMLSLGGGVSYQWFSSLRWSSMISYVYRSTSQSVSTGDGEKYEKKTLANAVISERHAILFGKEAHFYAENEFSSWDLIGQIGYEFGKYKPLAGYNALRTQFSTLVKYSTPTDVSLHGPTARLGGGLSFRGSNWQLRLLAYYQLTYSFASEQIWRAVSKETFLHDIYGGMSLGFGW